MGYFGKNREAFFFGKGFHFFCIPGVDIEAVDYNTAFDIKMFG
jgi:hypothetical protein